MGVSTWSVVKILLILLAAWFLYLVRDIIAILFVSLIFAAAISPWVDWFERWRIPEAFL